MLTLTKKDRDALPDTAFAVPETRDVPIHDKAHVRMAWNNIKHVRGITEVQRVRGQQLIMAAAADLGVDTTEWRTVRALTIDVEAMSLEVPEVKDHPNRAPFSGVLCYLDRPSDKAPHGSNGKRVQVTKAAAEKALPSLLGMSVDYTADFTGHDVKKKLGVITDATIEGDLVCIKGFLYEADFPDEVRRIQASKTRLGWSYEIQRVIFENMTADPLVITDFVFTGAALLRKDKAAYSDTSLSAHADHEDDMTKEELEALNASIAALTKGFTSLQTDVASIKSAQDNNISAAEKAVKAGSLVHLVEPHVKACHACADAMHAAGIGADPRYGHAAILHRMADHLHSEAALGRIPHIYRDHDYFNHASADVNAGAANPAVKALDDKVTAFGKQIEDLLKAMGTITSDVKASMDKLNAGGGEAQRKTLHPMIVSLLAKAGITPEGAEGMDLAKLDAALDTAKIPTQDRLKIKLALSHAGSFTQTH